MKLNLTIDTDEEAICPLCIGEECFLLDEDFDCDGELDERPLLCPLVEVK